MRKERLSEGVVKFRAQSARGVQMLYYSLLFLVLAIIAGYFGFGGVAGTATWIAQVLFIVFLVSMIVTAIYNLLNRKHPT